MVEPLNRRMASLHRTQSQRAKRALERMLEFQNDKARHFLETGHDHSGALLRRSLEVRKKLEEFQQTGARVLEVGSGAHGLIFFFGARRSEEHTSELQSLRHLVCRLLLENKKKRSAAEK